MTHLRTLRRRAYTAELASLGLTRRQIAAVMGANYTTVLLTLRSLGIKLPNDTTAWPQSNEKRAAAMAALYREGYTLKQIGEQYGLTRERVRQIVNKQYRMTAKDGGARKAAQDRKRALHERRNAECLAKRGCTYSQYKDIQKLARRMMADGVNWERTPMGAFVHQRRNAGTRGIGWELNFWQWWTIWQESGHWEQRGRGQGYVMCRYGDKGPYAVGNVYIATAIHNVSTCKNKRSGLPTGVQRTKGGRFAAQRQFNGKMQRLGTFDTPELAYAAYLMAAPQEGEAA